EALSIFDLTGFRLIAARLVKDDNFIFSRQVQGSPCLFVEHILFDGLAAQQASPLLELAACLLQRLELVLQDSNALLELLLRIQTIFALIGVKAKIGKNDHGDRWHDQPARIAALVMASPHVAKFLSPHVHIVCLMEGYPRIRN